MSCDGSCCIIGVSLWFDGLLFFFICVRVWCLLWDDDFCLGGSDVVDWGLGWFVKWVEW